MSEADTEGGNPTPTVPLGGLIRWLWRVTVRKRRALLRLVKK